MPSLSTRTHGLLDYGLGLVLIALPWLLGFAHGGAETVVPVGVGAAVLAYSLFTDYEMGLVRRIGMPVHLWLDALGGFLLAASPWIFGFEDFVRLPHLVLGLLEVGVAFLTHTIPSYERRRAR